MKNNKNKKKKTLIVIIVIIFLLVIGGCFLIFNQKADYISGLPNSEENPILKNIREQMTLDNSMEGFSNFTSQLYGTFRSIDSTIAKNSKDFDNMIASQIGTLDAYMSLYNDYNSYVNSLDNKTYSSLKSNWKKFAKQVKSLYSKIKDKNYTKGKNIITNDDFEKTFTSLSTEIGKFVNASTDENTTNTDTSSNSESDSETPAEGTTEEQQPSEENTNPEESTPTE